MIGKPIDFPTLIPKFDAILARGLSIGLGKRDGQMCIEAAICAALDLPHGDEPDCVSRAVRNYKVTLNDKNWSNTISRAVGLRNLGIAQIGSKDIVDDKEFTQRLAKKTISVLIPTLFREIFPTNRLCLDAAFKCEKEGTKETANAAAVDAADAAGYAAVAADAAYAANASYATYFTANASYAGRNKYLLLSASLALEVLQELRSPGCEWIGKGITSDVHV